MKAAGPPVRDMDVSDTPARNTRGRRTNTGNEASSNTPRVTATPPHNARAQELPPSARRRVLTDDEDFGNLGNEANGLSPQEQPSGSQNELIDSLLRTNENISQEVTSLREREAARGGTGTIISSSLHYSKEVTT